MIEEKINEQFLSIPDNVEDIPLPIEDEVEGFIIDNDFKADWAVRKINEAKAEFERLKAIADQQHEELDSMIEVEHERMTRKNAYLTSLLRGYYAKVTPTETATQGTYKLLSGKLILKHEKRTITRPDDDAQLVAWLDINGLREFIKIEEKPEWGRLKKRLQIVDNEVVDTETGLTVDCVSIEDVPESFEVK